MNHFSVVLGSSFLLLLGCSDSKEADSPDANTAATATTGAGDTTTGITSAGIGGNTSDSSAASTSMGGSSSATTTGAGGSTTGSAESTTGSAGSSSAAAGGSGGAAATTGDSETTGSGGGMGGTGSSNDMSMSFFVTSTPPSATGDLGGLDGADAHCLMLASNAGSTKTQWFAYLSTEAGPVNARDRIGPGPWYNAAGELFAESLDALHPTIDPESEREAYIAAKPADELFLDETGASVPSSQHDILTGSDGQGMLMSGSTCDDWTSSDENGSAQLGHSDTPASFSASWNSAHASQGCDADGLESTGGNGRIYCFATD